jgi:hypothetical protein
MARFAPGAIPSSAVRMPPSALPAGSWRTAVSGARSRPVLVTGPARVDTNGQEPKALVILFRQDFDDTVFPPAGWSLQTIGVSEDSWFRRMAASHPAGVLPFSGAGMAEYDVWDYPSKAGCRLISPSFDPQGAAVHVNFAFLRAYSSEMPGDSLFVQYSTDSGADWTTAAGFWPYLPAPGTPVWDLRDVALPAINGNVQVALVGMSDFGFVILYIDNVRAYIPFPYDVGVPGIETPVGYVGPNTSQPVRALVRNYGSDSATFVVYARMVQALSPYDTVWSANRTVSNLPSGDTSQVSFGDWTVPAASDSWQLLVWTVLASDSNPANNLNSAAVSSYTPRFGTVLGRYEMGDTGYRNTGITWRADSGRFYYMAVNPHQVFSFQPAKPVATKRDENWTFLNLGDTATEDQTWGIAWDEVNEDFWITQVPDSDISSCYAIRYTANGQPGGAPADTWNLGAVEDSFWFAGLARTAGGYFLSAKVGGTNRFYKLDLSHKQSKGFAPGPELAYRACCPFQFGDTNWILSGGWNQGEVYRLDTLGVIHDSAIMPELADCAVYEPATKDPDSIVCAFATINAPLNPIVKFSLGLTWGDLGATSMPEPGADVSRVRLEEPQPTPFTGRTSIRYELPAAASTRLAVYSAAGRRVRTLQSGSQSPGAHQVYWDGRDEHGVPLVAGVYFCRLDIRDARIADSRQLVRKLVIIE